MGSSIRNNRDQRGSARTYRERRDNTNGGTTQKTYDATYTAHSSSTTPPAFSGEPSSTDHQIDHVHEIIRDQLAPRIQTMSANAVLSDRREFLYFRRKRTGRRCSCYTSQTSPDNQCPVCLGTGIVAGYEKFGTRAEVLDFTSQGLVMVNVEPNFAEDTRPVYLRLMEGHDRGYVEAQLPIKNNTGVVDNFMLYQPIFNRGTKIIATNPLGGTAEIKEKVDLEPFLAFNSVKIRIEFTRIDAKPVITHFIFRYQIRDNLLVYGDLSRSEEEFSGLQSGVYEAYQEIPIFFDAKTLPHFRNEDVLFRCRDSRKFKIVLVNENVVAGVLTSTDVRARYLIPSMDVGINIHLLI